MIAELSVSQLAIIDQSVIPLGPGFTVLTGETGAGKSLLIDAIQLVLGERAETELVRAESKSAHVSVVFDISESQEIRQRCEDLGVPLEDAQLFLSREIFAEGRSQSRVGGRLVPNSTLRQLGELLVDLHGQHDHQTLLRPEHHLEYLDRWIGEPAGALLGKLAGEYSQFLEVKRKLEALRSNLRERDQRIDLLRYQVSEIDSVGPQIGEFEALKQTVARLQNLEKLTTGVLSAQENLSTGEGSAAERIGDALKSLESILRYDAELEAPTALTREILFQVEDVSETLSKLLGSLEGSPEELDELVTRLETLTKLRRKYGDDESAILEFAERARTELADLEDVEASEEELEVSLAKAREIVEATAQELSQLRSQTARMFGKQVETELEDLSLPNARFGVGIKPADLTAIGVDEVEFVFSANPGEPLRPLHRVASGGEVSRLMLALKTVLAGKAGVPTLIFDEIDSGLGGRVGATVGKKLAGLADQYQVIVISHLPQVAALASCHFKIEKVILDDGRTSTRVRKLSSDERLEEIARMLAGEQVTETARAHAKEMLSSR